LTVIRSASEKAQGQRSTQAPDQRLSSTAGPAEATNTIWIVTAARSPSAPTDRISAEPNYGSIGVCKVGQSDEGGGANYCLRFYNELLDSTGNVNPVCQRQVLIETALGEEAAVALGIMEFEKLENTSSWTTHARTIECTQLAGGS
jgi:hypothetical protein